MTHIFCIEVDTEKMETLNAEQVFKKQAQLLETYRKLVSTKNDYFTYCDEMKNTKINRLMNQHHNNTKKSLVKINEIIEEEKMLKEKYELRMKQIKKEGLLYKEKYDAKQKALEDEMEKTENYFSNQKQERLNKIENIENTLKELNKRFEELTTE